MDGVDAMTFLMGMGSVSPMHRVRYEGEEGHDTHRIEGIVEEQIMERTEHHMPISTGI